MTQNDALQLLRDKVAEYGQGGQARASVELGYSPGAISSVLQGKYKGNLDNVLNRVIEVYGGLSVNCPVLGGIPLSQCSEEKKKPFRSANEQAVRLFLACRKCPQNGGK